MNTTLLNIAKSSFELILFSAPKGLQRLVSSCIIVVFLQGSVARPFISVQLTKRRCEKKITVRFDSLGFNSKHNAFSG